MFKAAGWTDEGNVSATTYTNQEPGIYAFYENNPPTGYDRLLSNNNVVIYTAVVTGGLPVNVTVSPSSVTIGQRVIQTSFAVDDDEDTTTVNVTAQDPKKATLKAKKALTLNELTNSDVGNWSVTLNLYDASTGGKLVGSATISKGQNPSDIYFKDSKNNNAYFTVGNTYYLEEVVNVTNSTYADAAHFIWTSYQIDNETAIPVTPGNRYEIPIDSVDGFTITATNLYLYGIVNFYKYDENKQHSLSGAEFEVHHQVDGKWVVIPGATVTETTEGSGKYKAFIPLDSADNTTYRIVETKAPKNYVINPDPTKNYIAVQLSAQNNVEDFTIGLPQEGQYLINETGNPLEVTKFNNVKGAESITYADASTVRFSLYHWDTSRDPAAWVFVTEKAIVGDKGKIVFDGEHLLAPFEKYAVAETYFNPELYNRPDGIYIGNDKQTLDTITAIKDGSTVTVKDAYIFTNTGNTGTIALSAYNVPYLKPKIVKLDVGQFPSGVYAQMDFNIYEVASDFVASQESVENLVKTCTNKTDLENLPRIVFQGTTSGSDDDKVTRVYPEGSQNQCLGTSLSWEADSNLNNRWDPAKTYVLVETKVKGIGAVYDTMVKDDPRVVWYLPIAPVEVPTGSEEFILANINGVAGVQLTKTVVPSEYTSTAEAAKTNNSVVGTNIGTATEKFEVESLLTGDRKVIYTLAPQVTGKNQMLKAFSLKELGLTAGNPVAPDYEITGLVVGSATQYLPPALGLDSATIKADVTYYKVVNGPNSDEQDIILRTDTDVVIGTALTAPAGTKSFKIDYYSPEVTSKAPAYVLAEQFEPSASTVYMTVKQIPDGTVDEDGTTHPATEITQFTNKSEASLKYDKWKDDGTGKEEKTPTASDTANVDVTKLEIPLASVSKTSDSTTAFAGARVKYTLTITNKADSKTDFYNPVLIDILPTGVTFDSLATPPVSTGTQGEVLTLDSYQVKEGDAVQGTVVVDGVSYSDTEKCVIFRLGGDALKPGSSATVEFYAMVSHSAVAYDTPQGDEKKSSIRNDVYLSSSYDKVYHTDRNPYAYPFAINEEGGAYTFGESISEAASHNPSSKIHEQGVHDVLDDNYPYTTKTEYVWVTDHDTIPVVIGNQLNLSKAVKGDQDKGFHTSGLGVATRTVNPATQTHNIQNGWVEWQLQINNGQDEPAMNIVIGDAIPKDGDDINRSSSWDVIFDSFIGITNNKEDVADNMYTVWYYTGPISTKSGSTVTYASDVVKAAVKTARTWTATSHDDNWSTTMPTDKASITGFLIVFNGGKDPNTSFIIKAGHTALITYHTTVKAYQDDEDFADNRAFQNATNDFFVFYSGHYDVQVSNPVSVTLMDAKVQVEGDVWIDEDWTSKQLSTGNRRDYSQYAIVNQLADGIVFSMIDGRASSLQTLDESSEHGSNTDPGYGESVRHFTFKDLGAAAYVQGRTLYGPDDYLNVGAHKIQGEMIALKGTDPFHYYLNAEISDVYKETLLKIFTLTGRGAGHYMSDDPDHELSATADNSLDSNFAETGNGVYSAYPFYIRYSDKWDQSKDIGFRMTRGLEITKQAADDENTLIQGATFSVYGPYGDTTKAKDYTPAADHTPASGSPLTFTAGTAGEGENAHTVYTLDPDGTVTELVTDAKGKIYIEGLNWWKEYDVKEIPPAVEGYLIEGATAESSGTTRIKDRGNGVFTLLVPDTKKVDPIDKVTVKDPRTVDVQLEVEKILKMYSSDPMTFDFSYWLTTDPTGLNGDLGASEDDPIETITVTVTGNPTNGIRTAIGSFAPVTVNGAGTYVFSIKEIPGNNPNIKYDKAIKTATVVVEWRDADPANSIKAGLYVKSITYSDPDTVEVAGEQKTYEKFTNEYASNPTEATPNATKSISGDPLSYDVTFTFTLTADAVETDGAYIDYDPAAENNTAIKKGDTWSVDLEVKAGDTVDTVDFDEITYVLPGTYVYTIVESAQSTDPHFEYSDVEWTYKVVVDHDAKGDLEIASETYTPDKVVGGFGDNNNTATFVNKYTPNPTDWIPQAKKLMTGEPIPTAKTFKFKLTASSGNPDGAALPKKTEVEVEVAKNATESPIGKFADEIEGVLKGIVFTKAGTYTFQVEEIVPTGNDKDPHINYSQAVATFTVKVEDKSGQLTVTEVTSTGDVDKDGITVTAKFKNEYWVEPTSYRPKVHKTYIGKALTEAKTFKFTLEADPNNPKGADFTSADDPREASITVPRGSTGADLEEWLGTTIHFSKAGTFKFIAKETGEIIPGFTFDNTIWTLVVTVVDNNGVLSETHKYITGSETPNDTTDDKTEDEYAKFTNSYEVSETGYTPEVSKSMTMSKGKTKEDKTFTFTMTADPNNPTGAVIVDNGTKPGNKATVVIPAGSTAPVTAPFGGTPSAEDYFAIKFTAAGTYKFIITEDVPEGAVNNKLNGITYDGAEWTLTVKVDDQNSKLTVTDHTYEPKQADSDHQQNTNHAVFLNDYTPAPTDYTPSVNKSMTMSKGKTKEDKTFTFTMTALSSNPAIVTIDTHDGPNGVLEGTVAMLKIPAGSEDGVEASFGKIHFTEPGEYYFTIKEDVPAGAVNNELNGITYDPAEWTLHVVVVDNDAALNVTSHVYTPKNRDSSHEENTNHAVFLNDYAPKPTDLQLPVIKTLDGNNPPEPVIFTFTMTGIKDKNDVMPPMPSGTGNVATVTMSAGGGTSTITNFGRIDYDKVGTYEYKVVETVQTPISGMKYDKSEYKVVVEVTVQENSDTLSPSYKIYKVKDIEGAVVDPATIVEGAIQVPFVNNYTPTPKPWHPEVTKKLTDATESISEDMQFTFKMTPLSGQNGVDYVMPTDNTVTITGADLLDPDHRLDVTKPFKDIEFKAAGIYTFEIVEVKGSTPNMYYDGSVWTVQVEIVDIQGKLDVKGAPTYYKDTVATHEIAAVFKNEYNPASYVPHAKKEFDGEKKPDTLPQETFTFKLTADPTNPAGARQHGDTEVEVHEKETAVFGRITFSKVGTFKFTIEEEEPQNHPDYYHYDTRPWTLTIEVAAYAADDEAQGIRKGDLYVVDTPTYTREGDPSSTEFALITNTYTPKPVKYVVYAQKFMTGEPLPADREFTFELTSLDPSDQSGKIKGVTMPDPATASVTLHKDDTQADPVAFKPIEFTAAGIYTFQIAELNGGLPGFGYAADKAVKFSIEIEDDHGVLKIKNDSIAALVKPVDPPVTPIEGTDVAVTVEETTGEDDQGHVVKIIVVTAKFTNKYDVTPTKYQPKVTKSMVMPYKLSDKELTFNFTLELTEALYTKANGDTVDVTDSVIIPENAKKTTLKVPAGSLAEVEAFFGEKAVDLIEFKKAGVYKFSIKETIPEIDKREDYVYYDGTEWLLTVTVTDNNSQLEETHVYARVDTQNQASGTESGSTEGGTAGGTTEGGTTGGTTGGGTTEGGQTNEATEPTKEKGAEFTNYYVFDNMDFQFNKLGEVEAGTEGAKPYKFEVGTTEYNVLVKPFKGAKFALYEEDAFTADFEFVNPKPEKPAYESTVSGDDGVVKFTGVKFTVSEDVPPVCTAKTYYMVETDMVEHADSYWDNDAVYKVVVTPGSVTVKDGTVTVVKPTVEITIAKEASGTASGAGTGHLFKTTEGVGEEATEVYNIVNLLVSYRIRLQKKDQAADTPLDGVKFRLFREEDVEVDEDTGKIKGTPTPLKFKEKDANGTYVLDPAGTVTDLVTSDGGKLDFGRLVLGKYYLQEIEVPKLDPDDSPFAYKVFEKPILLTLTKDGATVSGPNFTINTTTTAYAEIAQTTDSQGHELPHDYTITVLNVPFGDLKITKSINVLTGPDPVTFVFQIDWKDLDGNPQTRYAAISFGEGITSETERTYFLKKAIPVGAQVTVTEVESGLRYTLTTALNTTPTISAEGVVGATFENTHDTPGGGYGVVNRFEKQNNGEYHWEKLPDSVLSDSGGTGGSGTSGEAGAT